MKTIKALRVTATGDVQHVEVEPSTKGIMNVLGGYVVSTSVTLLDGNVAEVWCLDGDEIDIETTPQNYFVDRWGVTMFGDVLLTGRADANSIESVPE